MKGEGGGRGRWKGGVGGGERQGLRRDGGAGALRTGGWEGATGVCAWGLRAEGTHGEGLYGLAEGRRGAGAVREGAGRGWRHIDAESPEHVGRLERSGRARRTG